MKCSMKNLTIKDIHCSVNKYGDSIAVYRHGKSEVIYAEPPYKPAGFPERALKEIEKKINRHANSSPATIKGN